LGPKAKEVGAGTFSKRHWNNPGVHPKIGQQARDDTRRWQTAPSASVELA